MDSYLKALFPDSFIVQGYRLRNFSVGHSLLFSRFEVLKPIQEGFNRNDFTKTIFFLTRDWEENKEIIYKGNLGLSLTRLDKKLFRWWRTRSLVNAVDTLIQYFEAQTVAIDLMFSNKSSAAGAPPGEVVLAHLKTEFGYTDAEVYDLPFSLAQFRTATFAEKSGNVRFLSAESKDKAKKARERAGKLKNWS